MQKDFQRGEHTESLEKSLDRTHRGISSCRHDDVYPLPHGNVLLPFDVIIISRFLKKVNIPVIELYSCTIFKLNFRYIVQLLFLIFFSLSLIPPFINIFITKDYT